MRTIKFRGQKTTNGIWVYGSLVYSNDLDAAIYYQVGNGSVKSMEWVYVKPDTIGQFTGLYDKNGKGIYEGDIISSKENPQIKHLIFYNEKQGKFMAGFYGNTSIYAFGVCGVDNTAWMAEKEVIGNIHDNPKLLENEKD